MPSRPQKPPLVVPMSLDGADCLVFDTGAPGADTAATRGWASFHYNLGSSVAGRAPDASILVRFGTRARGDAAAVARAPIELQEVRLVAWRPGSVLESPVLRRVALSRMVAAVNRRLVAADVRPLVPNGLGMDTSDLTAGGRVDWMQTPEPVRLEPVDLRVAIPAGRRRPDEFYAAVAEVFKHCATIGNRPAHDLAEANELPVSTVHRWVKEARVRGVLGLPDSSAGRTPGDSP